MGRPNRPRPARLDLIGRDFPEFFDPRAGDAPITPKQAFTAIGVLMLVAFFVFMIVMYG